MPVRRRIVDMVGESTKNPSDLVYGVHPDRVDDVAHVHKEIMGFKTTKVEEQTTFKGFKFKVVTDEAGCVTIFRVAEDRPWIPPSTFVLTKRDDVIVWAHAFKVPVPFKFDSRALAMVWLLAEDQQGIEHAVMASAT